MIFDSGLDILMGCGNPDYDNAGNKAVTPDYGYIPKTAWDALCAGTAANDRNADGIPEPWILVNEIQDGKVSGTNGSFTHTICIPRAHDTLQQSRAGDSQAEAYAVPFTQGIPTLADMTISALDLLSSGQKGFMLVVEGGAVDWANHANQSGRMLEEAGDFERAVEAVLRWINEHPAWSNAFVIVTSDHESGYLQGTVPGSGPYSEIKNNGINKAPGMSWLSTGHTNSLVPIFARGGSAARFTAVIAGKDARYGSYIDNIVIGKQILAYLR
jgi:alkaline phosphatase